jgi:hypothetical protein
MAGADAKQPEASAAFLEVLNTVTSGEAGDASAIRAVIETAAQARGLSLGDSTRDQAVTYFEQLRAFNYGPYSHGMAVQPMSDSEMRIAPSQ